MAQREPLYRHLADLTVSTDGRKVRQVATEIQALLEGAGE
jgi:shikimate kinase